MAYWPSTTRTYSKDVLMPIVGDPDYGCPHYTPDPISRVMSNHHQSSFPQEVSLFLCCLESSNLLLATCQTNVELALLVFIVVRWIAWRLVSPISLCLNPTIAGLYPGNDLSPYILPKQIRVQILFLHPPPLYTQVRSRYISQDGLVYDVYIIIFSLQCSFLVLVLTSAPDKTKNRL